MSQTIINMVLKNKEHASQDLKQKIFQEYSIKDDENKTNLC